MPYVTKTKQVTVTKELGYDLVPVHRPKFIYFEFTGLRPSAPHWLFFGKKEVTKFANTSYTKSDYQDAARGSVLKEPGERFVSSTEFPTGSGLTYGGATAQGGTSDPLFSNANGILKGLFYLQSNSTYKWPLNMSGNELLAIDVYSIDRTDAYSYAAGRFHGMGQYENYWKGKETQSYKVWVDPPPPVQDNSSDSKTTHTPIYNTSGKKTGTSITFGAGSNDTVTHTYNHGHFTATRTVNGTRYAMTKKPGQNFYTTDFSKPLPTIG